MPGASGAPPVKARDRRVLVAWRRVRPRREMHDRPRAVEQCGPFASWPKLPCDAYLYIGWGFARIARHGTQFCAALGKPRCQGAADEPACAQDHDGVGGGQVRLTPRPRESVEGSIVRNRDKLSCVIAYPYAGCDRARRANCASKAAVTISAVRRAGHGQTTANTASTSRAAFPPMMSTNTAP